MLKRARWIVLMDAAAGDGGAAGGGGATDTGAAASAAAGDGGAAGAAAAATSAMAAGAEQGAAVSAGDFFPEKFRVTKEDGSFDLEASARKQAESYTEMQKRFGNGEAAPKTAAEYTVTVPDNLKEAMGDLGSDPVYTKLRDGLHAAGASQKVLDTVMSTYFEVIPQLLAGGAQASQEQATAEISKIWPDAGERQKNIGLSYRAANSVAKAAGLTFQDIEAAGLGNNPTFMRLMAAIGPEMAEDSAPDGGASSGGSSTDDEIKALFVSEANTNPKHPEHKATRAKIDKYYEMQAAKNRKT